ncbi:hypothetical protein QBC40DRAFT_261098 [Triangularia verruculosa]|uniref:Uncharacterized protein n=1 Tax=Triangularia verruculosa TaxID=2587418 RepID=A0AAN7AXJ9_9PEZI|nr:hypothetical protein QBC40DRAFT_261098 [Triangularia verruculosa]
MLFTSVAGFVAVVYGFSGLPLAAAVWDTERYLDEGYTCLTPPKQLDPDYARTEEIYVGVKLCNKQFYTCHKYCNYRGGAVTREDVCMQNNGGTDDSFKEITYCYRCRCKNDPDHMPDLSPFDGSIQRYQCEREEVNCRYGFQQKGQKPPSGQCDRCPALQSFRTPTSEVATDVPAMETSDAADQVTARSTISSTSQPTPSSTAAPVPTAKNEGSDLWAGLSPERPDNDYDNHMNRYSSTRVPSAQPTLEYEIITVNSGAMRRAAGLLGVALAAIVVV